MRASLIRRLERLESARSRRGEYRLAWKERGGVVPQGPQSLPLAPGATVCKRRIPYNRYESQRKFDELRCTFKGFSGPVGSGKSKALCHEVIKCCYLNPGVPGLLGAPTEKLLASSTLIELLSILDQHGIPYRYRKSDNQIRLLEPDATILLRSLDNPERLRAMNLGWFGIDELTYCKEDAWLRLEGRIRHPQARYRRGFERNALQCGRPDSPAVYRPFLHRTHHRPRRGPAPTSFHLFRRDSNARLTLFLRYLNANSPLRRVPLYSAIWGAKYFTQKQLSFRLTANPARMSRQPRHIPPHLGGPSAAGIPGHPHLCEP